MKQLQLSMTSELIKYGIKYNLKQWLFKLNNELIFKMHINCPDNSNNQKWVKLQKMRASISL